MHVEQLSWTELDGWNPRALTQSKPELILYFGSRQSLASGAAFDQLNAMCPGASIVGCTTGGQIRDREIVDDKVVTGVAVRFDATKVHIACEKVGSAADSRACGRVIGEKLRARDLAGIFVLSDGLNVNGSELVGGISEMVGREVSLTGGLAGDGSQFQETLVGANCAPQSHTVAAIGFYGNAIRIGHGSAGGWDVFGPERRITRSQGNVLFELDGEAALDLYERYLGDEAKGLPSSGLLFPLQIQDPKQPDHQIVRTILAVDHNKRSLTFAGDVPEGWGAQLMRGNFTRLAEGAADAARQARHGLFDSQDCNGIAVLVSCIGRRLLMGQRTAEEIEAATAELGSRLSPLGFYSYGEISPHAVSGMCELHNQTMTVTTITEAEAVPAEIGIPAPSQLAHTLNDPTLAAVQNEAASAAAVAMVIPAAGVAAVATPAAAVAAAPRSPVARTIYRLVTMMGALLPFALVVIGLRFVMAEVFFLSGQAKIEGPVYPIEVPGLDLMNGNLNVTLPMGVKDSTYAMFAEMLNLPIPSWIAASVVSYAEFILPICLVLGFATRFAALGLLIMAATFPLFVLPEALWTRPVYWTLILVVLVSLGSGPVSLDHLIRRLYEKWVSAPAATQVKA